ncbi:MAG: hypothetical protein EXX96DRAFT_583892 [Benjaminiella poitrasii]|nr:MAG: hypothetical protein EXX96DRAFT_583892 [Benjaminiella poitrasii]
MSCINEPSPASISKKQYLIELASQLPSKKDREKYINLIEKSNIVKSKLKLIRQQNKCSQRSMSAWNSSCHSICRSNSSNSIDSISSCRSCTTSCDSRTLVANSRQLSVKSSITDEKQTNHTAIVNNHNYKIQDAIIQNASLTASHSFEDHIKKQENCIISNKEKIECYNDYSLGTEEEDDEYDYCYPSIVHIAVRKDASLFTINKSNKSTPQSTITSLNYMLSLEKDEEERNILSSTNGDKKDKSSLKNKLTTTRVFTLSGSSQFNGTNKFADNCRELPKTFHVRKLHVYRAHLYSDLRLKFKILETKTQKFYTANQEFLSAFKLLPKRRLKMW